MAVDVDAPLTPLLEDVQRPIPGDNPVGEDISYDDDFLALKDEIDQLSSVNPEGVDFDQIIETCQMLLGQKSKDLRVSTYLAMALAKTEGFRGILEGLRAQELLLDGYWEVMYPPLRRMRARGNALQFLTERLTDAAEEQTPGPGDYELLESAIGVVQNLQGFTMEAMGEDAPVLSRLKKALEEAQRKAPKPEAAPAPEPAQPAVTPVATTEAAPEEPAPVTAQPATSGANGEAEGSLLDELKHNPTPLLMDVANPIPGDNPVGEDISYDDDFLALKDEIDQLSSVNPEGVDFDQIIETCQMLLGQKSKDLRVSTYLAMALAKTEGFRGILEGLRAQELLLDGYWEVMYPPLRRMRARGNALQFLTERLTDAAEEEEPTAADKEPIEGALAVLQSVQAFTMEAMGEDAPVLSRLKKALDEALRKVPKPKPVAPPPKSSAPATTAAPTSSSPAAQTPAASRATSAAPAIEEPQSATDALFSAITLANFIQEQAPTNPSAYRLARTVRWDDLQEEPNNQQGKTMLEDLAPHRLTYLNSLVEEANWATLLSVAENTFKELPYHFLLDLQRFVVTAMDGLGAPYQAAKQAVLFETAMLLKRVPGLPRLTFMNGLPFADNATQFWIEQTVEPVLASGKGGGGMAEGDDKVLAEQHEEAKKLFAEGKLAEALGILQKGARQDGSPRSRFRRRFYMALLCMQGNQPVIACPMLEDLDQEIERYSLASWEPDLALEVWTHLHRCYELLRGDENAPQDGLDDRARRIFAKICQIDVTRALKTGV